MALRVTQQFVEFLATTTTEDSDLRLTTGFVDVGASGGDYDPDARLTTAFVQVSGPVDDNEYTPTTRLTTQFVQVSGYVSENEYNPTTRLTTHWVDVAATSPHRGFTSILGTPKSTLAGSTFILGARVGEGATYVPEMTGRLGARDSILGRSMQIGDPANAAGPPAPTPTVDTGMLGTINSVLGVTMIPAYPSAGANIINESVDNNELAGDIDHELGVNQILNLDTDNDLDLDDSNHEVDPHIIERSPDDSVIVFGQTAHVNRTFTEEVSNDGLETSLNQGARSSIQILSVDNEIEFQDFARQAETYELDPSHTLDIQDEAYPGGSKRLEVENDFSDYWPFGITHTVDNKVKARDVANFLRAPDGEDIEHEVTVERIIPLGHELDIAHEAIQGLQNLFIIDESLASDLRHGARWNPIQQDLAHTMDELDHTAWSSIKMAEPEHFIDVTHELEWTGPVYAEATSGLNESETIFDGTGYIVFANILTHEVTYIHKKVTPVTSRIWMGHSVSVVKIIPGGLTFGFLSHLEDLDHTVMVSQHEDVENVIEFEQSLEYSVSIPVSNQIYFGVEKDIIDEYYAFELGTDHDPDALAEDDDFIPVIPQLSPDANEIHDMGYSWKGQRVEYNINRQRDLNHVIPIGHLVTPVIINRAVLNTYHPFVGSIEGNQELLATAEIPAPPRATLPPRGPDSMRTDEKFRIVYPQWLIPGERYYDLVFPRSPEYGNRESLNSRRISRETAGGYLVMFRRDSWIQYYEMSWTFTNLTKTKIDEILWFLEQFAGAEIGVQDHHGRFWRGTLLNLDNPATQDGRGCQWTIQIDMEAYPVHIIDLHAHNYIAPLNSVADIPVYPVSVRGSASWPIVEHQLPNELQMRVRPASARASAPWDFTDPNLQEYFYGIWKHAWAVPATSDPVVEENATPTPASTVPGTSRPVIVEEIAGVEYTILPPVSAGTGTSDGSIPPAGAGTGTSKPVIDEVVNWRQGVGRPVKAWTDVQVTIEEVLNGRTVSAIGASTDPTLSYDDGVINLKAGAVTSVSGPEPLPAAAGGSTSGPVVEEDVYSASRDSRASVSRGEQVDEVVNRAASSRASVGGPIQLPAASGGSTSGPVVEYTTTPEASAGGAGLTEPIIIEEVGSDLKITPKHADSPASTTDPIVEIT